MKEELNVELKCQSVRSLYGVWPLTACMEVKNKYVYVITQDICNKFKKVVFFVESMVSQPNCLLQSSTTMSLINKISERMSCQESATFLTNLAYIPYIRQNHSTFELVATKNKKVISNESYL